MLFNAVSYLAMLMLLVSWTQAAPKPVLKCGGTFQFRGLRNVRFLQSNVETGLRFTLDGDPFCTGVSAVTTVTYSQFCDEATGLKECLNWGGDYLMTMGGSKCTKCPAGEHHSFQKYFNAWITM